MFTWRPTPSCMRATACGNPGVMHATLTVRAAEPRRHLLSIQVRYRCSCGSGCGRCVAAHAQCRPAPASQAARSLRERLHAIAAVPAAGTREEPTRVGPQHCRQQCYKTRFWGKSKPQSLPQTTEIMAAAPPLLPLVLAVLLGLAQCQASAEAALQPESGEGATVL